MNKYPGKQKGASPIFTIIVLALLGYGLYIGIQYVPQLIEAKSIGSILSSIESTHRTEAITDMGDVRTSVIKMLQINEMDDMIENLTVKRVKNNITITFIYDRELNLGYEKKPMHYEKVLILK